MIIGLDDDALAPAATRGMPVRSEADEREEAAAGFPADEDVQVIAEIEAEQRFAGFDHPLRRRANRSR